VIKRGEQSGIGRTNGRSAGRARAITELPSALRPSRPAAQSRGRETERGVFTSGPSAFTGLFSCATSPDPLPHFVAERGAGSRGWQFPHAELPRFSIGPPHSEESKRPSPTMGLLGQFKGRKGRGFKAQAQQKTRFQLGAFVTIVTIRVTVCNG